MEGKKVKQKKKKKITRTKYHIIKIKKKVCDCIGLQHAVSLIFLLYSFPLFIMSFSFLRLFFLEILFLCKSSPVSFSPAFAGDWNHQSTIWTDRLLIFKKELKQNYTNQTQFLSDNVTKPPALSNARLHTWRNTNTKKVEGNC